jgi:hypothetical protein
MTPEGLASTNDEELFNVGKNLVKAYPDDLSSDLPGQLLPFRSCMKTEIPKLDSVQDLMILMNNHIISPVFLGICTALFLFLILPVIVEL